MASPYSSSLSQCPPSPVPFVPPTGVETCTSPIWDEYLATNNSKSSFEFTECTLPVHLNFDDPQTVEPRGVSMPVAHPSSSSYASTSTSSGPLRSYSTRPPVSQHHLSSTPLKITPTNQKHQASSLLSPVSFPLTTMSPIATTFPLTIMRPYGIKTFVRPKMHMPDTPSNTQVGRWTKREHELFLEGLQRFGKSWKKISSLVHTRTLVQIRTHAQKYLQKQSRAAIKADVKAAGVAIFRSQPVQRPQHPRTQSNVDVSGRPTFQLNAPMTSAVTPQLWKTPRSGDHNNGFAPLTFPNNLPASASTSRALSSTSPRSSFQLNSTNRLDQLLQDDNSTIPAFVDEYYSSPTAIEDGLLRPLYTSEQWLSQTEISSAYINKRRRLEPSLSTCSGTSTLTTVVVPALRSAFPSLNTFEPLQVPNNLSSPSNSPTQRQSAVLLAAHETDGTIDHASAWL
ncbi:unnamed protein product [Peronospora destructor]|uniref:HTH myb-type domain-containing protein n=1 Tax=Peronospora destructor TaxID=86335 RepID=A0AAV0UWU3_9STRA|nr:unnamed protein product [Peronospora destructor]